MQKVFKPHNSKFSKKLYLAWRAGQGIGISLLPMADSLSLSNLINRNPLQKASLIIEKSKVLCKIAWICYAAFFYLLGLKFYVIVVVVDVYLIVSWFVESVFCFRNGARREIAWWAWTDGISQGYSHQRNSFW